LKDLSLFDIENGTCVRTIEGFTGELQSLSWSFYGDVMCTTSKDKFLSLVDVRGAGISQTTPAHGNHRSSRSIWLGSSPYVLSCGFTTSHEREMALWDSRNMSSPVRRSRVDSSTGPLMPHYDPDHNFLLLMGKGDSSIRVYEFGGVDDSATVSAEFIPLTNKSLGAGGSDTLTNKGLCVLPKQVNNVMGCEILRALRLTENSIQPISFVVPRKERQKFHADLFPPTCSSAPPALQSAEWFAGATAPPLRVPITPPSSSALASSVDTGGEVVCQNEEDGKEEAALSPNPSRVASFGSTLKYRHLYGKDFPRDSTWYNLTPNLSSTEGPLLACNGVYWAVPYKGAGGAVYVNRLDRPGKVDATPSLICGHRGPVLDLSFSPFHLDLLATASDDSQVKLWRLPDPSAMTMGLPSSLSEADALGTYTNHSNSVKCVSFHPRVDYLLASASADSTIRLWDVNAFSDICATRVEMSEGASITNIDFNNSGYLMLAACKDRVVRILDPRQGMVVQATPENSLGRNLRAAWCNSQSINAIVTTFVGSTGRRQIQAWDPRQLDKAVMSQVIDSGAGALFPLFDEDTGMVIVAGRGDTFLRIYEFTSLGATATTGPEESNSLPPFSFARSADHQSTSDPIAGICLLPKTVCDYRNVEVNRVMKLTDSAIAPLSFFLPRAENLKGYFQDDIYPPTRTNRVHATIDEWLESDEASLRPLHYQSLKPDDMEAVSFSILIDP
jgi:coronin-7